MKDDPYHTHAIQFASVLTQVKKAKFIIWLHTQLSYNKRNAAFSCIYYTTMYSFTSEAILQYLHIYRHKALCPLSDYHLLRASSHRTSVYTYPSGRHPDAFFSVFIMIILLFLDEDIVTIHSSTYVYCFSFFPEPRHKTVPDSPSRNIISAAPDPLPLPNSIVSHCQDWKDAINGSQT